MQNLIMHFILLRIDLPLSSQIITSPNKNLWNHPSTKHCSSGQHNLPKMAVMMYLGHPLQRCMTLLIKYDAPWKSAADMYDTMDSFDKAITLGGVCHSVMKALSPKNRQSG